MTEFKFTSHLNNVRCNKIYVVSKSNGFSFGFDNAKQPVFPVADHLLCSGLSLTI